MNQKLKTIGKAFVAPFRKDPKAEPRMGLVGKALALGLVLVPPIGCVGNIADQVVDGIAESCAITQNEDGTVTMGKLAAMGSAICTASKPEDMAIALGQACNAGGALAGKAICTQLDAETIIALINAMSNPTPSPDTSEGEECRVTDHLTMTQTNSVTSIPWGTTTPDDTVTVKTQAGVSDCGTDTERLSIEFKYPAPEGTAILLLNQNFVLDSVDDGHIALRKYLSASFPQAMNTTMGLLEDEIIGMRVFELIKDGSPRVQFSLTLSPSGAMAEAMSEPQWVLLEPNAGVATRTSLGSTGYDVYFYLLGDSNLMAWVVGNSTLDLFNGDSFNPSHYRHLFYNAADTAYRVALDTQDGLKSLTLVKRD